MSSIIFSLFIGLIIGIVLTACYDKGYNDARQYMQDKADMAYRKGFYDCLRDKEKQKMNFIERRQRYFGDFFRILGYAEKVNTVPCKFEHEEDIMWILEQEHYIPKKIKPSKEMKKFVDNLRKSLGIKRKYKRKGTI